MSYTGTTTGPSLGSQPVPESTSRAASVRAFPVGDILCASAPRISDLLCPIYSQHEPASIINFLLHTTYL
eukprot:6059812-Prymnesium_polylepis.1